MDFLTCTHGLGGPCYGGRGDRHARPRRTVLRKSATEDGYGRRWSAREASEDRATDDGATVDGYGGRWSARTASEDRATEDRATEDGATVS